MTGVYAQSAVKRAQTLKRDFHLRAAAAKKVAPTDSVGKKRVPRDDKSVAEIANASERMPRGVYYRQPLVAEVNNVTVAEQYIRLAVYALLAVKIVLSVLFSVGEHYSVVRVNIKRN